MKNQLLSAALFLATLLPGLAQTTVKTGTWRVVLKTKGGDLPFGLAIEPAKTSPSTYTVFALNGDERLLMDPATLSDDSQRRLVTNPLRVLDCKVPQDQLVIEKLPSIQDSLCDPCRTHFDSVKQMLDARNIAYRVNPRMVRGLDYYMRTTFEVVHGNLGAQNSVLGGGRYDGLAEELGSKVPAPGIGFSIGEDRLVMTIEESQPEQAQLSLDLFAIPMGEDALQHLGLLARHLRRSGVSVEVMDSGKVKRGMELANKLSARFVVILGENELRDSKYALKNMATGEQSEVTKEQLTELVGARS